jgi:hypothetical protein
MRGPAGRRSAAGVTLSQGFSRLFERVRCRLAAYPQTKSEWSRTPLADIRLSNYLAGAHESGSALELLERQQPEGVAHQHGDSVIAWAAFNFSLPSSQSEDVSG